MVQNAAQAHQHAGPACRGRRFQRLGKLRAVHKEIAHLKQAVRLAQRHNALFAQVHGGKGQRHFFLCIACQCAQARLAQKLPGLLRAQARGRLPFQPAAGHASIRRGNEGEVCPAQAGRHHGGTARGLLQKRAARGIAVDGQFQHGKGVQIQKSDVLVAPQRADGKLRACAAHGALPGGHGKAVIWRGGAGGGGGARRALRRTLRGAAGGEQQQKKNHQQMPALFHRVRPPVSLHLKNASIQTKAV